MEPCERHNPSNGPDIASILVAQGLDGGPSPWTDYIQKLTAADVERALAQPPGSYSLSRLAALVCPAAVDYLEQMAQAARDLTIQRFGRTVRLYAPLYLSNFCINSCLYCGFNKQSPSRRVRLSLPQALAEADTLAQAGFRDILLVSSEDRSVITIDYLVELAEALQSKFSSISIEIYQVRSDEYARLFAAGIEGVTLYQETYDRSAYRCYHPAGPKADYDNRLSTPDNIGHAGMREIGLGVLLGLADWRLETLALAEHARYLMKRYWKSHISFSFPRLRPANQVNRALFRHIVSDIDLVQMITALRLCFADAGLVLSTRESPALRDHLVRLGITKLSAGSRTSPGGYSTGTDATEQFLVSDHRCPAEVARMIRAAGAEPVWKDWQRPICRLSTSNPA